MTLKELGFLIRPPKWVQPHAGDDEDQHSTMEARCELKRLQNESKKFWEWVKLIGIFGVILAITLIVAPGGEHGSVE